MAFDNTKVTYGQGVWQQMSTIKELAQTGDLFKMKTKKRGCKLRLKKSMFHSTSFRLIDRQHSQDEWKDSLDKAVSHNPYPSSCHDKRSSTHYSQDKILTQNPVN